MQSTKLFDERLKTTLKEATEQVTASDLLKRRIVNEISNQKMKEGSPMKKIKSLKKIAIIAAAICCLASVSVYASGRISSRVSSSSKTPTFTQMPKASDFSSKLGFTPKTISSFSNGYKFENATVINSEGLDDNNKTVEKGKQLNTKYKSEDGQEIDLYADTFAQDEAEKGGSTDVTNYNGIEIKYTEQLYKFVPVNYEMTAQDKADKESGKVMFSYGTKDVSTNTYKSIKWYDNGVKYMIMAKDSNLSKSDFTGMAEELINQ